MDFEEMAITGSCEGLPEPLENESANVVSKNTDLPNLEDICSAKFGRVKGKKKMEGTSKRFG